MIKGQLLLDKAKWLAGWMSLEELSYLAEISSKLPENAIIFEIGSFCGRSSRAIADNAPGSAQIYCIDPWNFTIPITNTSSNTIELWEVDDSTFDQFCLNLDYHIQNEKVHPIRTSWENFDPGDEQADFIFIDADHEYDAVCHDVNKAIRYLKPNGILAGHDYQNFEGVYKAVNERFKKADIEVRDTIWRIRKFSSR